MTILQYTNKYASYKFSHVLLIGCFVLILVLLSYSNTLWVPFQFDDLDTIVNNPVLFNLSSVNDIFKLQPTRFIVMYSFALNYAIGSFDVFGYHLFNILTHFLACIGVVYLVLLVFETPVFSNWLSSIPLSHSAKGWPFFIIPAALAGFFFATHPIQTEAVTYIWQRNTSLAAFFYIWSLCFFLKYRLLLIKSNGRTGRVYLFLSILFTVLGMFTKENTFTIPIAILFLEFFCFLKDRNHNLKYKIRLCSPHIITLFIIPLITILIGNTQLDHINAADSISTTPLQYFLTQLTILHRYLALIIYPKNLSVTHDVEMISNIFNPYSWVMLLIIIGVIFLAFNLRKKVPYLFIAVIFFFLFNGIESSFIPLEDLMFEHRMYLPMVGICILVAGLCLHVLLYLARLWSRPVSISPLILVTFLMLCFIPLTLMTYAQNNIWQSKESLWANAVSIAPKNDRTHTNLGNAYMSKQEYEKAIKHYKIAVSISPDTAINRWHYGSALVYTGEFDLARKEFEYLKNNLGRQVLGEYGLGLLSLKMGQLSQAEQILLSVWNKMEKRPADAKLRFYLLKNIAELYEKQGRLEEAKMILLQLIEIKDDFFTSVRLARVFKKQGDRNNAIKYYEKSFHLRPADEKIRKELDRLYRIRGSEHP